MKQASFGFIVAAIIAGLSLSGPSRGGEPVDPPFPAWVFGHVVWEDESTTADTYALVKGYQAHGMPVDGVIIDSPWETEYNTFEWDPKLYPDARKMIDDLRGNDIRLILWITSMVNLEDPEYDYCLQNGYFVKGMEKTEWWKGTGGMIDYDNPQALEWWHKRMDRAIDMGVDGWKCDGTDPFMLFRGWNARKRYSAAYYSDFFDYTRERTGEKTVIMARPMEQILNENVFGLPVWANPLELGLYLKYAPLDKSYMSWVGDQDPTFDGLKLATRWILDSARNDYLVVGSDIGGYRAPGPEKEVFIRWAQFGALCPFMENGGHNEHRPWAFDAQTLRIYRAYALLHKVLLPYLYSEAIEAWQEGRSMMKPLSRGKDHYLLGRDILVAPIQAAGGKKKVVLPRGNDWFPLFADPGLMEDAGKCRVEGTDPPLLKGGCSFTHVYPLESYPVFIRAGGLVPLAPGAGKELFGGLHHVEEHPVVVLLIPPAPGRKLSVERTVYMEGRAPVRVAGKIDTSSGLTHTVTSGDAGWPIMVPSFPWPTIPESVPPISWKE